MPVTSKPPVAAATTLPAVVLPSPDIEIHPESPSLADALKAGALGDIAQALCADAALSGEDLDALRKHLDDAAQIAAVGELQSARWGAGNAAAALASLRAAFGKGVRLRRKIKPVPDVLPPLYPRH